MKSKYPDKIAVGAAWPGFDDSRAAWTLNRHMSARCGKTFEDSFAFSAAITTASNRFPSYIIVTWNDYEEGTAIERGYGTCGPTGPQSAAAMDK